MNQELLKQQIIANYFSIKAVNERYSKRAYAKKLGISHGPLVEIMNGKRKVSVAMAKKLCERLPLSPRQIDLIISKPITSIQKEVEFELKEDQFFLISDCRHFALLNLIKIKSQSHKPKALAERLDLSEDKVRAMLERLLRLEMIEIDKNGNYRRTKETLKTSDDVLSLSIKAAHKSMLGITVERLDDTALELRDFSSITMAINTKKIAAAKQLIRKFQDDLSSLLEDEKADEVYSFNMQLIPMTKKGCS